MFQFKQKLSLILFFRDGRAAQIQVGSKPMGIIGEIKPEILENLKIRVPVVGFEIKLTGLIFD